MTLKTEKKQDFKERLKIELLLSIHKQDNSLIQYGQNEKKRGQNRLIKVDSLDTEKNATYRR